MDIEHKTSFLGTERIFPLLLKLGIPAAIGMIVNALYNIVDTIFVGQGVGPLAIAALSIVFPLQMIVSSIAQAIGVGASSIVSRRLGEKRPEEASRVIGTAYASVALITAVLVALVVAFTRPILAFFGASDAIMPYAMEYASIVAPGFFFFSLSMAASNLIRAEGNAQASMRGMMIGAIANTALDPLFIFGFGMGVGGAAAATVASQALSCAYFAFLYLSKRTHVRLERENFAVRPAVLRESALLGAPAFIQSSGMSILALLMNNSLGWYGGDEAVAIYGMNHRVIMLVIFPILGIVQGFQPIVGYNYGAKAYGRVRSALKIGAATVGGIALFMHILLMRFPRVCVSLFINDPALIDAAARVLRVMTMLIPLGAVQILGSNYFQAIGKKTPSLVLGLSRQFLVLIPLVLILPRFFGLAGIWFAFPVADLLSTILTTTLLVREVRRLGLRHAETEAARASA